MLDVHMYSVLYPYHNFCGPLLTGMIRSTIMSNHLNAPLGYKLSLGSSAYCFVVIRYNKDINWLSVYRCGIIKTIKNLMYYYLLNFNFLL